MNDCIPLPNPFVGLRPFENEDSLYFFGREEQTRDLLQQLHRNRFIAVVGSSGAGKSSLVRAGLIPHLEGGILIQDRDAWLLVRMKPGEAPLDNLAEALLWTLGEAVGRKQVVELVRGIRRGGVRAVLARLAPVLQARDANLFLLIDQFEEVFRLYAEQPDRSRRENAAELVSLMLRLAEQRELPVFVCLTMRSDFLGDCDRFQGLPEAMNRSQYLVPRLTRDQRREAITRPVQLAGSTISPRVLDRLLNESLGTRDDLPILQHALMRTWDTWAKRPQGPIDLEHYERIGTAHQALNAHADEALCGLGGGKIDDQRLTPEQSAAKCLFQLLTQVDKGNRLIRRPTRLSRAAAVAGVTPQDLWPIIRTFQDDGRDFLVLSDTARDGDPMIDISHESLIRQWTRLGSWVEEEANSAAVYLRLADAAERRQIGKAEPYRGVELK